MEMWIAKNVLGGGIILLIFYNYLIEGTFIFMDLKFSPKCTEFLLRDVLCFSLNFCHSKLEHLSLAIKLNLFYND